MLEKNYGNFYEFMEGPNEFCKHGPKGPKAIAAITPIVFHKGSKNNLALKF